MIILNKNDEVPRQYLLDFLRSSMQKGIPVTIPEDELADATKRLNDAKAILQTEFGIANPNSNPQLTEYALRSNDEDIHICCFDERKQKYSFAAENIAKLIAKNNRFAIILQRYKDAAAIIKNIESVQKFKSPTYTSAEGKVIERGMIHPMVSLQATNRISYTDPALMNISKKILWKMIEPRNEGWELWSVDVKNQEPWIFSHIINDVTLTKCVEEAYTRKESFYKVVFEHVYGKPVTNDYEYTEFKTGWNMLTYGGTKQGLLERCKVIDGAKLYEFYSKLPGYKAYSAECRRKAYKGITKDTTYFGSIVESGSTFSTSALARSLADIPIQGTGADILALLVKNINTNIMDDPNIRGRIEIYYTRHDEIIFQFKRNPGETDEDIIKIFHDIADHMIDAWVPFMIDVERVK